MIHKAALHKDVNELVHLSKSYGANPDVIQGGGGNTSLKADGHMWVKASGVLLKNVQGINDFIGVNLKEVRSIFDDETMLTLDEKERNVKAGVRMLSSRIEDESGRPSIETFLHALMKEKFVIHSHPIYVNAVICTADGKERISRLFHDSEYLFLPYRKPGYPLGFMLYTAMLEHNRRFSTQPGIVFLQNHGLIISGNSVGAIDSLSEKIMHAMHNIIGESREQDAEWNGSAMHREKLLLTLKSITRSYVPEVSFQFMWSECPHVNRLCGSGSFVDIALQGALYPDHIVYCGERPLILEKDDNEPVIKNKMLKFIETFGYEPRYTVVPGAGVLITGSNAGELKIREEMLRTHVRTMSLITDRGDPLFIDDSECRYIAHWEAEKYRQKTLRKEDGLQA